MSSAAVMTVRNLLSHGFHQLMCHVQFVGLRLTQTVIVSPAPARTELARGAGANSTTEFQEDVE